jgi:hypothetical protein
LFSRREMIKQSEREFLGGGVLGRGHAGSPGSGGASPHPAPGPHHSRHFVPGYYPAVPLGQNIFGATELTQLAGSEFVGEVLLCGGEIELMDQVKLAAPALLELAN